MVSLIFIVCKVLLLFLKISIENLVMINSILALGCYMLFLIGSQAFSSAKFGAGTGFIHTDDVRCVGNESRLVDCSHTTRHNCRHSEDASVRCLPIRKGIYCACIKHLSLF